MLTAHDRKQLTRFIDDCREALGASLRGVILVGDAADEHSSLPHAPLSTVVLVDVVTMDVLGRTGRVVSSSRKQGIPTPLLLDSAQLTESARLFPLEILALQDSHAVLCGDAAPLAGLALDPVRLRQQVEEQMRGKLLHLRQSWLEVHGRPLELRNLLLDSGAGFEWIARGMLKVAGHQRSATAEAALQLLECETGLDLATLRRVRAAARDAALPIREVDAIFERYHEELAALASACGRLFPS